MPRQTMQVRTMALGLIWALGSLGVAGEAVGAARPQEPEAQSSAPAAKVDREGQENNKAKPVPDSASSYQDPTPASSHGLRGLGKDFLGDQKQIWTSPMRLRFSDADWLVPMSGFAAGLFSTDRDVSTHLSNNPKTISHYKTLSSAGVAALAGGEAGLLGTLSGTIGVVAESSVPGESYPPPDPE